MESSMAKVSPFSIVVMFLAFIAVQSLSPPLAAAAGGSGGDSVHDLLREHGLPAGLLPKEIESFVYDWDSGLLEVRLDQPCYAVYDSLAHFDRVIRGNLSHGALRGVEGFFQEELFLWLPVKGVLVSDPSSGVILLDILLAHKHLSLSLFEDPPDCRPAVRQVVVGEGLFGRKFGFHAQI